MIRFIDLFCGIGGFRLGLERANDRTDFVESHKGQHKETKAQSNGSLGVRSNRFKAGYHCVWSSDIDRYARQIYKKNFGEEPEGDITKIPAESIPDHDLLCAGFPCQAFSIAGKRKGFQDTRGTLFFDIARILSYKRPRYFLLENVDGLLSDNDGKTFHTILGILTNIGYLLQSEVLNSKNYSVPQNRKRVFIVGHLRGERRSEVFPVGENDQNDFQGDGEESWGKVGVALTGKSASGQNARGNYVIQNRRQSGEFRIKDKPCVTANYGLGGGNVPMVCGSLMSAGGNPKRKRDVGSHGILSKNTREKLYRAILRRLTPVECERLQGFPDNWTESVSDTQRYKLLGNAVTVNVIEFLGRSLLYEH